MHENKDNDNDAVMTMKIKIPIMMHENDIYDQRIVPFSNCFFSFEESECVLVLAVTYN